MADAANGSDVDLIDLLSGQMENLKKGEESFKTYKLKLGKRPSRRQHTPCPPRLPQRVRETYGLTQGNRTLGSRTPDSRRSTGMFSCFEGDPPRDVADAVESLSSTMVGLFDKVTHRLEVIEQRQQVQDSLLNETKEILKTSVSILKQLDTTFKEHSADSMSGAWAKPSFTGNPPSRLGSGLFSHTRASYQPMYDNCDHAESVNTGAYQQSANFQCALTAVGTDRDGNTLFFPSISINTADSPLGSPRGKNDIAQGTIPGLDLGQIARSASSISISASRRDLATGMKTLIHRHAQAEGEEEKEEESFAIRGEVPGLAPLASNDIEPGLLSTSDPPHTPETLFNALYDMAANQDSVHSFCSCLALCVCHIGSAQEAIFDVTPHHEWKGIAATAVSGPIALTSSALVDRADYDPEVDCLTDGSCPIALAYVPMTMEGRIFGMLRVYNKSQELGRSMTGALEQLQATRRVSLDGMRRRGSHTEREFSSVDVQSFTRLLKFACPMLRHVLSSEKTQADALHLANLVGVLNEVGLVEGPAMHRAIEKGARELTRAEHCRLCLYDSEKPGCYVYNGTDMSGSETNGMTPYAIKENKTLVIAETEACESFNASAVPFPVTNALVAPIALEDKTLGALEMYNMPKDSFADFTSLIIEGLTKYAAVALVKERSLAMLEAAKSRSNVMVQVCKELAEVTLDTQALYNNILEHARRLVNADRAALFMADWKRKVLYATFGGQTVTMPINKGIAGTVAVTGIPLNISDAYNDTRFNKNVDVKSGYSTKTLLSTPVKCDGKVVAVAQLVNKHSANGKIVKFDESDEQVLETFTTFAGIALRISDQYKTLSKERERASLMLDAVSGVADTDIREGSKTICCNIMYQAKTLLAADRCSLFMIDKEKSQLYSCVTDQQGGEIRVPLHSGIAGEAARIGTILNIPDAYKDKRFNTEQDRLRGYVTKSVLTVPVRGEGEVLAVMQLINKKGDIPFDDLDEQVLSYFSSLAGILIRNSQLYEFATQGRAELTSVLKRLNEPTNMGRRADEVSAGDGTKVAGGRKEVALFEGVNHVPPEVVDPMVEMAATTEFDIHEYIEDKEGLAKVLAMVAKFFEKRGLLEPFNLEIVVLQRFLAAVALSYRFVPYHNVYHAIDVAQTIYAILNTLPEGYFTKLEEFVLLVCGVAHDIDHMGLNNSFHYKAETPLGILSNATGGTSALEIHHCDVAIAILQRAECNIFRAFPDRSQEVAAYKLIIKCILGTDMAVHQSLLKTFGEQVGLDHADVDREALLIMVLKAADISNVVKPFEISRKWAYRVNEEFYFQGDQEVNKLGEVSNAMFDRNSGKELAEGQVGFISFFAKPFFQLVAEVFPPLKGLHAQLCANKEAWSQILATRTRPKSE